MDGEDVAVVGFNLLPLGLKNTPGLLNVEHLHSHRQLDDFAHFCFFSNGEKSEI